jgi:hypothetical protein
MKYEQRLPPHAYRITLQKKLNNFFFYHIIISIAQANNL